MQGRMLIGRPRIGRQHVAVIFGLERHYSSSDFLVENVVSTKLWHIAKGAKDPRHTFDLGMIDCSDPNTRTIKNSLETCLRFLEGKFFVSESRSQIFSIYST